MHYYIVKYNKSFLKLVSSSNLPTELSALDVAFVASYRQKFKLVVEEE